MPAASGNKYDEKRLAYVQTKITEIPDPGGGAGTVVGTAVNYGFWTNVDDAHNDKLGHTVITPTNYFTPQANLVIGANFPKPGRAGKRFATPIGIVSTFCSDNKQSSLKQAGWNVSRSLRTSPLVVGSTSSFVKGVYVTIQGVKYGWNMPIASYDAIGATERAKIGVIDMTESDKNDVVFGVNMPRPPRAKAVKEISPATANAPAQVNSYSTYYDPSKANAIVATGTTGLDWVHTKNGRYTAR